MQTRNGKSVKQLTQIGECYVGIIDGKILKWNLDGRRSGKNRSKHDLVIENHTEKRYANVVIINGRRTVAKKLYSTKEEAIKANPKNYVKTIEL